MLQVLKALDQNVVSTGWKSGDPDQECLIASGMAGIMDGIYEELNACCLEKLSQISIGDIDRKIFGGK